MNIAGLSMNLAQNRVQSDVGVAMLAKSLDSMETTGAGIANMIASTPTVSAASMEQSVTPYLGSNFDFSV